MMEPDRAVAAISHAAQMIRARTLWEGASSALFHLAQRLSHLRENTRIGRSVLMMEFLGVNAADRVFTKWSVQGQINGLNLRGFVFNGCTFRNVEFRNCAFDDATEFQRAHFQGALTFENCENTGKSKVIDCDLSDDAERAWDMQAGRASRRPINENVARDALRDVLRRFIGPFGFSTIKEVDKNSGSIMKNPCRDIAWEELTRGKFILRHTISGITEGGLHISTEERVKHEVRNFLDNAALGPQITRILELMLKRI